MAFDVSGKGIERALDPAVIGLVAGGNVELREKRLAEIIRREQAVQIAALHTSVARDRAFRFAVQPCKWPRAIRPISAADVDFISLDRLIRRGMHGRDTRQRLLR